MRLKISEILEMTGGRLLCGSEDTAVTAFSTDSREIKGGVMFVPIIGERIDGHSFIDAVCESGAAASFTDRELPEREQALVLVPDCRAALQRVAACYRERFELPIVGVTGSVGKTSSKEMIAQVLTAGFNVMKTAGNKNSQIGVPQTIFTLRREHTAAVVEMGVSMPGEMARISEVVKPTCAVMTNIGVSHIEYMKTRENILAEKARISDYIPNDGVLFINGDDELLSTLKTTSEHRVESFGLSQPCDWRASDLREADGGTFFTCTGKSGESIEMFVPASGAHNVRNALASMAVARHLGISSEDAVRALAAYKPPAMRQQIGETGGVVVIDDSYNASPDSMRSAIDVLVTRPVSGRRIAVLADMLELGEHTCNEHFSVGSYAEEKGVDILLTVGELARDIARGYGEKAESFLSNAEAAKRLKELTAPGDAVLIKGSRGMATEKIVEELKAHLQ